MAKEKPETAQFLNVDLEIDSRTDLQPLVTAFGKKVFTLYVGRYKRTHMARLELARVTKGADATILGFCKLIEALPGSARKHWDAASKRDFSIGVEAASEGPVYDTVLEAKTVRVVADLGGRIVFTLYPPILVPATETPRSR